MLGEAISVVVRSDSPAPLPGPISVDVTLKLPNGSTRTATTTLSQEQVCMPIDPVTPEDLKKGPFCQLGPIRDGNAFFPGPAASGRYLATATGKPAIDVAPLPFEIASSRPVDLHP